MQQLLTFSYYFNFRPDPNFQYTKLTVLIIVLLLALSIALKIYRKKGVKDPIIKKMLKRYPGRFFTLGVILLFLLVSRETGIPFAAMRVWWYILFLYTLYWAVKVGLSFKKEYRRRSSQAQQHASKAKWLPKKKKK